MGTGGSRGHGESRLAINRREKAKMLIACRAKTRYTWQSRSKATEQLHQREPLSWIIFAPGQWSKAIQMLFLQSVSLGRRLFSSSKTDLWRCHDIAASCSSDFSQLPQQPSHGPQEYLAPEALLCPCEQVWHHSSFTLIFKICSPLGCRDWRGKRGGNKIKLKKWNQFILSATERGVCSLTMCLAALPRSRLLTSLH